MTRPELINRLHMKKQVATSKSCNARKTTSKLKREALLVRERVKPHLASRFTVRMDSRTIRRLNRAAKTRRASVPDLIRTAVATFLEMVFDGEETFGISNYQLRRA